MSKDSPLSAVPPPKKSWLDDEDLKRLDGLAAHMAGLLTVCGAADELRKGGMR